MLFRFVAFWVMQVLLFAPSFSLGKVGGATCKRARQVKVKTIDQRYETALSYVKKGYYKAASDEFFSIHLDSNAGELNRKCMLLEAYCLYRLSAYEDAVTTLDDFFEFYPLGPDLDYAHYLKMLCFWEEIGSVRSSTDAASSALSECRLIVENFHDTDYGIDAASKAKALDLFLLRNKVEGGRLQLKRKNPVAALLELQPSLADANEWANHLLPEIHFRMLEAYSMLGIADEGSKHEEFLRKNCPDSIWTKALDRIKWK